MEVRKKQRTTEALQETMPAVVPVVSFAQAKCLPPQLMVSAWLGAKIQMDSTASLFAQSLVAAESPFAAVPAVAAAAPAAVAAVAAAADPVAAVAVVVASSIACIVAAAAASIVDIAASFLVVPAETAFLVALACTSATLVQVFHRQEPTNVDCLFQKQLLLLLLRQRSFLLLPPRPSAHSVLALKRRGFSVAAPAETMRSVVHFDRFVAHWLVGDAALRAVRFVAVVVVLLQKASGDHLVQAAERNSVAPASSAAIAAVVETAVPRDSGVVADSFAQ